VTQLNFKKKISLGFLTAFLGIGLIGGGTFAYFSDVEETNNTFAAGTLDLSVDPTVIIDVDNLKPGDVMTREFYLINDGSLDIAEVLIHTEYTVDDAKGDNGDEDFGEHILVHFLENVDKTGFDPDTWEWNYNDVISSTTLADLRDMTPDAVESLQEWWHIFGEESGLVAGDDDYMYVAFEFVDNGQDQNVFQGDTLHLKWTFEAKQTEGEYR